MLPSSLTLDRDLIFFDLDFNKFFNPLLLNISDPIGTQILLKDIRVIGLNSIKKFTLLDPIGKYTLQNEFNWDQLKIEVTIKVTITPSTNPNDDNAILYSPSGRQIIEDATIILDFQKLNIIAGLFSLARENICRNSLLSI